MSAILSRSDGQKPSRQRITVLSAVVTVAFVLLSIHLFNLQVIQGSWFRTVAREVARREIPIHAPRGEIFDGNFDAVLVSNETTFAVDVIPGEVPEERLDDVFRKLAQAIDVPLEQIVELGEREHPLGGTERAEWDDEHVFNCVLNLSIKI